jgi:hypothetical protein
MKIDLAIHSSDSNPFYLDFWPLVSKVWKQKFGIEPLLVYIDENHDIPIDETYGKVIKMKPIPDVPMYLQCQWVRFWIPSQFPDKVCLLSDIDMFPVSKRYFLDQIKEISDEKYVHLNPYHQFIPVCYHLAKGETFSRVLRLHSSWEDSIRHLHSKNLGHDCTADAPNNPILKDKPNWGAEEEYVTQIIRNYSNQSIFVFLKRSHDRLDRSMWKWTPTQIQNDVFADAHSIRPYTVYKTEIDRFISELLK